VEFANGARAMLDLCMFAEGAEHQEEITATGDKARLDVLIPPGDLVFSPRVGIPAALAGAPRPVERTHVAVDAAALKAGSHHGSTYYQHEAFARAV
ncbi:hypothetical protein, partial [Enterococcus faecium]|uniref:hypothetical protein n=1 Tax=Enterococcus faecium TaxID=1352 RepID=UPI0034E9557D